MLRVFIQGTVIFVLVLLALCSSLADAGASPSYRIPLGNVGIVTCNSEGELGAVVAIEVNSIKQVPVLNEVDKEKAEEALMKGNELYTAESLRDKSVVMTVYTKWCAETFTLSVRNLYQPNQEITGFQRVSGCQLP